jgi:hypothetical protein
MKKIYIYNSVIVCGKKCPNIFIGLKNTCLGVLDKRKYVKKDNETGLKEGGVIEIENLQCFIRVS